MCKFVYAAEHILQIYTNDIYLSWGGWVELAPRLESSTGSVLSIVRGWQVADIPYTFTYKNVWTTSYHDATVFPSPFQRGGTVQQRWNVAFGAHIIPVVRVAATTLTLGHGVDWFCRQRHGFSG